jgi:hypothetical protein
LQDLDELAMEAVMAEDKAEEEAEAAEEEELSRDLYGEGGEGAGDNTGEESAGETVAGKTAEAVGKGGAVVKGGAVAKGEAVVKGGGAVHGGAVHSVHAYPVTLMCGSALLLADAASGSCTAEMSPGMRIY